VQEQLGNIEQKIAAGEITVPKTDEELQNFTPPKL
jgi:hypothetical protein